MTSTIDEGQTTAAERRRQDRIGDTMASVIAYADGWTAALKFLQAHPDTAAHAYVHDYYVNRCVGDKEDALAAIEDAARRGVAAGFRVTQEIGTMHGGVKIWFGPIYLYVYAERDRVCTPIVVGKIDDVRYAISARLDGITEAAS
jgi:hypothetical protein